jgi:hypothetical protein
MTDEQLMKYTLKNLQAMLSEIQKAAVAAVVEAAVISGMVEGAVVIEATTIITI